MIDYFHGVMWWPINADWTCPVCDNQPIKGSTGQTLEGLTWGVEHGVCRCDKCHAVFLVRQGETTLDEPLSIYRPEFVKVLRDFWQNCKVRIDEMNDQEFAQALEAAGHPAQANSEEKA